MDRCSRRRAAGIERATRSLQNKFSFAEVSIKESLYDKGAMMSDINKFPDEHKLTLVGLGTDYRNLTGNAFFLKFLILDYENI